MQKFISVDDAKEQILGTPNLVGVERVMLSAANGRRLAETILATEDSPPFDNSAMDGFALNGALLKPHVSYPIVGESAAGRPFVGALPVGSAIRIMTGAQLPTAADTVIVREVATVEDESVTFSEVPVRGANIRTKGSAMALDELVLDVGSKIGPGEIGLLASFQRATVSVFRKPVVAVLTTGDELVEVGGVRKEAQIVNSNAYMLRALLEDEGCDPFVFPIIPDQLEATRDAFKKAINTADVVISVGGVSVGDYDWVKTVLDEVSEGAEFWKIQMKPGKPLAYGKASNGVALLGLPGNPVSAFVCYQQFVGPLLRMIQGVPRQNAELRQVEASCSTAIRSTPKRRHYVTGTLKFTPEPVFTPFHDLSSGNLVAIGGINALAIVELGVSTIGVGETCLVDILN